MYERTLSSTLKKHAKNYPLVGITGPRQSGKTTLAKLVFNDLPYVSLEDIDIRDQAKTDPRGFLKKYDRGAIFDEIQHVPDLLSYLQTKVDGQNKNGRYIITGSQNFVLNAQIAQSLSGRIGMSTLLPLSMKELERKDDVFEAIFQGGYPRLHNQQIEPIDFYPSYIQTYIERDLRQLINIENVGRFQTFIKLCAGRIGQLVNFTSLANDAGISHTTARQWVTILEASYIIFTLQPHHQNFNKRLIKMPKLYFYDTGLACTLLGLENKQQLSTHYAKGSLFENLVILEVLKQRMNMGRPHHLYFWRNQTGHEVDLLAEWGGKLHAVEIKSNATFQKEYIKNLRYFLGLCEKNNLTNVDGYLIYNGKQTGDFLDIKLQNIFDYYDFL